jgi:hypothetical protein
MSYQTQYLLEINRYAWAVSSVLCVDCLVYPYTKEISPSYSLPVSSLSFFDVRYFAQEETDNQNPLTALGSDILTLAAVHSTKTKCGGQVIVCSIILGTGGQPGVGNSTQVGQSPPCLTPLKTNTAHNCGQS